MGMVTAANLVSALRAGQLLEAQQLAEAARLQTFFADAKALAGDLIQRGWLTPFQANLLLQGRGQDLCLGAYVLLERVGEGGMGTVYKARQRSLGRIVAVKVIRKDRTVNPQAVKRFQREIRAAAQLDHPNIVRAFDADEIAGTLLLVMEYVENGTDLSQIVKRDGRLSIATACEYMRQAALGLQHAHERGLVHRDIKPQNLLVVSEAGGVVSEAGGVVSGKEDGTTHHSPTHHSPLTTHQVKILDMGLALLNHPDDGGKSSTSLTGEGTVMGTVDYIAPEQALDSHHVDIRADLYSLGCTFYYLLTGRVPFPGGDAVGKLIRQQTEEPEPFEMLRPQVAPAVAAIVRKLMAKRREHRFQTPAELAVALEDVLKRGVESHQSDVRSQKSRSASVSGTVADPKLARQWAEVVAPSSATEALVKPPVQFSAPAKPLPWRWLVGSGAAALVLLILVLWQPWRRGGDGPTSDSNPVTKRKTKPPSPEELAEQAEKKRYAKAEEALKPIAERVAALGAGASPSGEALRKDLREFLMNHSATPAATKACDLLGQVLAKLPSPLDQLDAAKMPAHELEVARRTPGASPPLQNLVAILGDSRLKHWAPVRCVAFSPDGKMLASASEDSTVKLWNPATGNELRTLKGHVYSVAFSSDGKTLASASLKLWDPVTGSELRTLKGHTSPAWSVALSPDGKTLAAGSNDGTVKLWDLSAGRELRTLKGHTNLVYSVAFSPNGKTLASASDDGTVKLWDPAAGSELRTLKGHTNVVRSVAFSPDGKTLASGGADQTVKLWDSAAGSELRTLKGHTNVVMSVAFSPDGKTLASGCDDQTVKLWDLVAGSELHTLKGHTHWVMSVAFSPDGKTLASGSYDQTVKLWDVESGKEVQPLTGSAGSLTCLTFTADDGHLVVGDAAGLIHSWNTATGKVTRFPKLHSGAIRSLSIKPDDERLLSTGGDSQLLLWNPKTGKRTGDFDSPRTAMYNAVFSPDGQFMLGGGANGLLGVWDAAKSGNELRRLPGHQTIVTQVAILPDNRRVVAADNNGPIRVWDFHEGKVLREIPRQGECRNLRAAPDGRHFLASTDNPRGVFFFDPDTGKQIKLSSPAGDNLQAAFSPDGKLLAILERSALHLHEVMENQDLKQLKKWSFPGPVHAVAFTHDGRHLATANGNGTVYIFRLADGPPRALTAEEAKKQQVDEAKRLGVAVQITNSIGMKLNLIPAARFLMGSPGEPGRYPDEWPRHEVAITKPFHIGVYEVTQAEYEKVTGKNPSKFNNDNGGGPDHPVEMVWWDDAVAYCKKLSELPEEKKAGRVYRLPTEAEWEYACRAGTQMAFSVEGDKFAEHAWYLPNSDKKTHAVGKKSANHWGLYDAQGNVWEWCSDWFAKSTYISDLRIDPTGPLAGKVRVIRGGAFDNGPAECLAAVRTSLESVGQSVGFRVVCEYRPPLITNSIGMKLARIPAGKFLMGSPDNEPGRQANEGPQHEVTISKPFHIGVYEVTQQQYEKVTGTNPSKFNKDNGGGADHPVEQVSWEEAVGFCKKVSELSEEKKAGRVYRLPTEAEWEYAYRAGTQTRYPFGEDKSTLEYAWLLENSGGKTHPIGRLRPNPWGLFDMGGNVWENDSDFYDAAGYPAGPRSDPQGPATGQLRVVRGSGIDYPAATARAAARGYHGQDNRNFAIGFRVVCEIAPSK